MCVLASLVLLLNGLYCDTIFVSEDDSVAPPSLNIITMYGRVDTLVCVCVRVSLACARTVMYAALQKYVPVSAAF